MLEAINGYKTYIGGAGLILTGLVGLVLHFVDAANAAALPVDAALALISSGLAAIGLGHKINKSAPPKVG